MNLVLTFPQTAVEFEELFIKIVATKDHEGRLDKGMQSFFFLKCHFFELDYANITKGLDHLSLESQSDAWTLKTNN